jgi:hypothetical protein
VVAASRGDHRLPAQTRRHPGGVPEAIDAHAGSNQILRVVIDSMLLQKLLQLFAEAPIAMMLFLPVNLLRPGARTRGLGARSGTPPGCMAVWLREPEVSAERFDHRLRSGIPLGCPQPRMSILQGPPSGRILPEGSPHLSRGRCERKPVTLGAIRRRMWVKAMTAFTADTQADERNL